MIKISVILKDEKDGSCSQEVVLEPYEGGELSPEEIIGAAISIVAVKNAMEPVLSETMHGALRSEIFMKAYQLILHCLTDSVEPNRISSRRLREAFENGEIPVELIPIVMSMGIEGSHGIGFDWGVQNKGKDEDKDENEPEDDEHNLFRKDTI